MNMLLVLMSCALFGIQTGHGKPIGTSPNDLTIYSSQKDSITAVLEDDMNKLQPPAQSCQSNNCKNDCRGHKRKFQDGECRRWTDNAMAMVCTCSVKLSAVNGQESGLQGGKDPSTLCRNYNTLEERQQAFEACTRMCGQGNLLHCDRVNGCQCNGQGQSRYTQG